MAICGRTQRFIEATVAAFEAEFPGRIFGQPCDVSDAAQVAAFAEAVQERFGTVSVLINNSGLQLPSMWIAYLPMFFGVYVFTQWVDRTF